MRVRVAADPTQAAALATAQIARLLRAAARQRGAASIAFSGGKTPALMLAALARRRLPWAQIDVFQVDERLVPADDQRRNARLLDVLPTAPGRRHDFDVDAATPAAALPAALPDQLDVVHLGMGADGHTASWPPGDPVIDAPGDIAFSGIYQGTRRVTLTPSVVNRARVRVVVITGADKAAATRHWLEGGSGLPISVVTPRHTYVYLDAAASGGAGG